MAKIHSHWMKDPYGLTEVAQAALHYNILPHVFDTEEALLTVPLSVRYPEGPFVQRGNWLEPAKVSLLNFVFKYALHEKKILSANNFVKVRPGTVCEEELLSSWVFGT